MIIETLLGGLLGGVTRLAPEVMKMFDRKNERAHELKLGEQELQRLGMQGQQQSALIAGQNQMALDAGGLAALIEGVRGQAQATGIKWVDGINALVRPTITYWTFGLFTAAKVAGLISLHRSGVDIIDVLRLCWGAEDQAMLSGIVNFWFLDRVIRKNVG